jgi:hypothetical protein
MENTMNSTQTDTTAHDVKVASPSKGEDKDRKRREFLEALTRTKTPMCDISCSVGGY